MAGLRDDKKHAPYETEGHGEEHRDPITGAPGSHPIGAGVGAAGGGAAGAAIGAVAGPVGAMVGAAIGGIAGGLLGKGVAEGVNPTDEHAFWEKTYRDRPYYREGFDYSAYGPAYQYGWESCARCGDRSFEEMEPELRRDWEANRGPKDLDWEYARPAVSEGWQRMRDRYSPERPS